jgi:chaperone required for assembly of F1-ATPase
MKELFEQGLGPSPLDPNESARTRPVLRKRFYTTVSVTAEGAGFSLLLDGKTVRTPARRPLVAPRREIADALAAEWEAQQETIDPTSMPMTRLANSIIDGVTDRRDKVAADIAAYFETDMLFYRADSPEGLVARQAEQWDPVVRWAADELGARFILAEGIIHARQPDHALQAARKALPLEPWTIGALHAVTTLTGSALLALAMMHGFRDVPAVWEAAHVDQDWNFGLWGADEGVIHRRNMRETEMRAADLVFKAMKV